MTLFVDNLLGATGRGLDDLPEEMASQLQTLRALSGGFIVTSLLWGSWLSSLIDGQMRRAAAYALAACPLSLFGVMHSPLRGGIMHLPWRLDELPKAAAGQTPYYFAAGYALVAALLFVWSFMPRAREETPHAAGD